jgi:GDSL-like Lipase/Acylhydrolase family
MSQVVLLGDSIFDNAAYVGSGPDVIQQLRARLPAHWNATLLAVDGSMTFNVSRQLDRLSADATHLILSIGGNDAINNADILQRSASSTADALNQLGRAADQFEHDYNEMLRAVLSRNLPTAICTIYYPCFPDVDVQRLSVTALTVFNDCIIRAAVTNGLPLIDLRLICNDKGDYANPIEPSVQGGEKISAAIKSLVMEHDFTQRRTVVFV